MKIGHVDWLINRIEELEMQLSINTNNMKQLQKENECYKQRVEELEKELTHQSEHFDICYYVIEKEKKVVEEQNKRYKQALENITISPIPLEIDDAVNIALQALESDNE